MMPLSHALPRTRPSRPGCNPASSWSEFELKSLAKKMIRIFKPSAVFGLLLCVGCSTTNNVPVHQKGEFATIDTRASASAISAIQNNDSQTIGAVRTNSGAYQPPVLYAISSKLFQSGQQEEALYWFYLGQLRARSDANKALDPSSAAAVDTLNSKYGPPINRFAFQNIPKLKAAVSRAIATDASQSRNYDPRWIALHGMDAFTETQVRFKPRSEWSAINEKTRKEYQNGFKQAIAAFQ